MTSKMPTSPYLDHPKRLGEVIAALQVMGSYPTYASREHDKWEGKLGKPESDSDWAKVCGV
jgi:hypothetical protein